MKSMIVEDKNACTHSHFDLVCCEYGAGGPLELFSGPVSDGKLIFSVPFEGKARLAESFRVSSANVTGHLFISAVLTCLLLSILVG